MARLGTAPRGNTIANHVTVWLRLKPMAQPEPAQSRCLASLRSSASDHACHSAAFSAVGRAFASAPGRRHCSHPPVRSRRLVLRAGHACPRRCDYRHGVAPAESRSPRAPEDGGGMAQPGGHGSLQHGREPPRSQLGQTWFTGHEAHLLPSRFIVNAHSSKNRHSETIPDAPMGSAPCRHWPASVWTGKPVPLKPMTQRQAWQSLWHSVQERSGDVALGSTG